ncbi:hypothetical protein B0H17DRAFT_1330833 [Mycena rosella]|uniref:Uncharacterized protein n=1 Tax=Mycena rosella TaxID=1033263 RepID=A0AAD7DJH2_MYCRO|nr:hypothetical protein B0H17DRAFT_1330833 [Mycena rosella]
MSEPWPAGALDSMQNLFNLITSRPPDLPPDSDPPDQDDLDSDDTPIGGTVAGRTPKTMRSQYSHWKMAEPTKKQKKLSPESHSVVEEFLHSSNPVKHNFILLTSILQCSDMLTALSDDLKSQKWKIPETLKKTATDYARAAAVSAFARCYRGKSLGAAVIAALRERNVSDLPAVSETGRTVVVSEFIGSVLTTTRHAIKVALQESITKKLDIATTSKNCLAKSKAKPTAAVYHRVAWLCYQLVQQTIELAVPATAGKTEKEYWPQGRMGYVPKAHKARIVSSHSQRHVLLVSRHTTPDTDSTIGAYISDISLTVHSTPHCTALPIRRLTEYVQPMSLPTLCAVCGDCVCS